jgi:hypothetical protein
MGLCPDNDVSGGKVLWWALARSSAVRLHHYVWRHSHFITANRDWEILSPNARDIVSFALFIATLGIATANDGGAFQFAGTILLNSGLLYYALRKVSFPSRVAARHLLKATGVYLPLQFLFVLGKN